MGLFHKDPEEKGLRDMEKGVEEFKKGLSEEEEKLKELFKDLKTDLLDEFLTPGAGRIKEEHIRILMEQVRHVISIARAIGCTELIDSFEEEEHTLKEMRDLVEQYPDISVDSSPDLRASLEKLRRMLKQQQDAIFNHEEILVEEKRRLVDILNQVKALKKARERDPELSSEEGPERNYA